MITFKNTPHLVKLVRQLSFVVLACCLLTLAVPTNEMSWGQHEKSNKRQLTDISGDPLPKHAVARMGTVRLRQSCNLTSLLFSPDSRMIASAGEGELHVWDARTGEPIKSLGQKDDTRARCGGIAFSDDGTTIAVAKNWTNCWVDIRDLKTGRFLRKVQCGSGK